MDKLSRFADVLVLSAFLALPMGVGVYAYGVARHAAAEDRIAANLGLIAIALERQDARHAATREQEVDAAIGRALSKMSVGETRVTGCRQKIGDGDWTKCQGSF